MSLFTAETLATVTSDPELLELASDTTVSFNLGSDSKVFWNVAIADGAVSIVDTESPVATDFTIDLPHSSWTALLEAAPQVRKQHLLAHVHPRGTGEIVGSAQSFAQHLHIVRRLIEAARPTSENGGETGPALNSITGRYVRLDVPTWGTCDVFYETVGNGPPLILLATAGADTRQWHGVMTDERLTSKYTLIAFDLPWHGKSSPAAGRRNTEYSLDTTSYTDCIAAFIDALELDEKPTIVGASMAGAVVVEMLALHPERVAGAVGAQAGPRVTNRHTPWLRNPTVNQTLHVPEWTYGLMNPASPKAYRDRVWWGYSQGGFSVYERDITYYSASWDIDNVSHRFNGDTPPLVLLSGAFDYSVPPEQTKELAGHVPGAVYKEMPELGHFPHAENPPIFTRYLLWSLGHIKAATVYNKENS
jgi:pimeloyl-ACP methyl ester carboxylesterase